MVTEVHGIQPCQTGAHFMQCADGVWTCVRCDYSFTNRPKEARMSVSRTWDSTSTTRSRSW